MKFKLIEKAKQGLRNTFEAALSMLEMMVQVGLPGGGAAVSFAFGKWVAGLVLVVISLGVLFRLLWRRRHADQVKHERTLPMWAKTLVFLGAIAGSATLVEMVNLPVRFDQAGFSFAYWLIVIAAIGLIYSWLSGALRSCMRPRSRDLVAKS